MIDRSESRLIAQERRNRALSSRVRARPKATPADDSTPAAMPPKVSRPRA
jgi:hypothetical protein